MPARTPEEVLELAVRNLNEGDLAGLVALFEPTAAFVPQPGTVVSGTDQRRGALQQFLSLKPKLTHRSVHKIQAGDIAIFYVKWSLTGTGPDGKPVNMEGLATNVVRRQADSTWKYAVTNPFGTAVMG